MGDAILHTPHHAKPASPNTLQKVRGQIPKVACDPTKLSSILRLAKGGFSHRRFKQETK
ncbi:hypothetical protein [Phyllobacterium myrsinacearum]|uniref:Uncharacterized protein n=1 Tax=Phyllobacterium myrsinacearum TaxID=28101 RepID=A0A839ECG0_9HYPH|nr:hypothetical protein [Phyllobacterium myrsinacearum]MBA8876389.1 hypothetical protein [Phyllobacterium myrsinacearum]